MCSPRDDEGLTPATRLFFDIVCGALMIALFVICACIAVRLFWETSAWLWAQPPTFDHWFFGAKDNWFALLGAIFGSLITLAVYFHSRRKERQAAVANLIERLSFNKIRCEQMLEYFGAGKLPTFDFDTNGIIIWLSRSEGILRGETIEKINWHRYQLDHLN